MSFWHVFISIYFFFLAVSPRKTSNANEPKSAPPNMKGSSFLNHDHTHAIIYKSDPPVRVSSLRVRGYFEARWVVILKNCVIIKHLTHNIKCVHVHITFKNEVKCPTLLQNTVYCFVQNDKPFFWGGGGVILP